MMPGPLGEGEETHLFGAVYDHWIADSRAMREFMQRVFVRYQGARGGIWRR